MFPSLASAYQHFLHKYADSDPVRDSKDFEAAVRAARIPLDDLSEEWIESLDNAWVYGRSDRPFDDDRANREYRRLVTVATRDGD